MLEQKFSGFRQAKYDVAVGPIAEKRIYVFVDFVAKNEHDSTLKYLTNA